MFNQGFPKNPLKNLDDVGCQCHRTKVLWNGAEATFLDRTYQVYQLLAPAPMHIKFQELLLSGIKEVFTDENREILSTEATPTEVKAKVWRGNQIASPGSEGIILYFYKYYWKEVGKYLHLSILDNFRRKAVTKSHSVGLVVFGNKPGKGNSIKFKNKRRISLLNVNYKINSSIFTSRPTN